MHGCKCFRSARNANMHVGVLSVAVCVCSAVLLTCVRSQPRVPIGGRTSDYAELHLAC